MPVPRLCLTLVAAVALALTACATPRLDPTPTPTAVFASEEEALAAASDLYARYSAAYDQALAGGGINMDAVAEFVTADYLQKLSEPGALSKNGWHTEGVSSFDSVEVVDFQTSQGKLSISARLCRDVSAVRILTASGDDVSPTDGVDRIPLVVHFEGIENDVKNLVISEIDPWTSEDFCQ